MAKFVDILMNVCNLKHTFVKTYVRGSIWKIYVQGVCIHFSCIEHTFVQNADIFLCIVTQNDIAHDMINCPLDYMMKQCLLFVIAIDMENDNIR